MTCDCPAAGAALSHTRDDHDNDCHLPAGVNCGACWACVAYLATARQVLASRGPA
jgi:hypothetical protein